MSYTRGTSTITTNGLIYHLDIPNPLCYHSNQNKCYSLVGQTTGEVENNVSYFNESKGCLNFNGVNTYINISNNFTFITEQTLEVWVKLENEGPVYQRIIDKSNGNNGLNGYALIYHPTLNMIYYIVNDGINKDMVACKVSPYKWLNIIATKNNTEYKLYINGILSQQNTGTSTLSTLSTNTRIGAYTQSQERNFKGKINNIKIYNKALTQEEINVNYKALKNRFI